MQRLEVSVVVRPTYVSLGVKRLMIHQLFWFPLFTARQEWPTFTLPDATCTRSVGYPQEVAPCYLPIRCCYILKLCSQSQSQYYQLLLERLFVYIECLKVTYSNPFVSIF